LNFIINFLSTLDSILLLIIIGLIIIRWNYITIVSRILGIFIMLSFVIQTTAFILAQYSINNFFLVHILALGEMVLLSLFYYYVLDKRLKIKNFIPYFIPIFSLLIILNSIFREPITGWNSSAKTFTQGVLIIYAIAYFYDLSTREILVNTKTKSLHFINSAILLYYAGSLFIFMFAKVVMKEFGTMQDVFWVFNALLYFVFCVLILIGIWKIAYNQEN
jgi:hypothetical protein